MIPVGVSIVTGLWHQYGSMKVNGRGYPSKPRSARPAKPLTGAALNDMALAYVARFATTARGLERYCLRKLRERGWEGSDEGESRPDVAALVARFVEMRYVDDGEFARARSGSLLRRGYGARRVGAALDAAGVAQGDRSEIGVYEARLAALRMAEKRRFGPFGADGVPPADRSARDKQIAAMLRAGHSHDSARQLVEATDGEAARAWVDAARDDEREEG